jgi:uncharacterized protein
LLDDQVNAAAAALDAYEATGDQEWLEWARVLMERVWRDYSDPESGGLFDTARGRRDETGLLPTRAKPIQDAPTPSPNGVAGIVGFRLFEMTGDPRWQERTRSLIAAFAGRVAELGLYAATYLLAVDWELNPTTHLVIVGDSHDETARTMHAAALAGFVPRRAVQLVSPNAVDPQRLPVALRGMLAAGKAPRGYACTGMSCSTPAEDLQSWVSVLESLQTQTIASQ